MYGEVKYGSTHVCLTMVLDGGRYLDIPHVLILKKEARNWQDKTEWDAISLRRQWRREKSLAHKIQYQI
jgi:hypothetical protein